MSLNPKSQISVFPRSHPATMRVSAPLPERYGTAVIVNRQSLPSHKKRSERRQPRWTFRHRVPPLRGGAYERQRMHTNQACSHSSLCPALRVTCGRLNSKSRFPPTPPRNHAGERSATGALWDSSDCKIVNQRMRRLAARAARASRPRVPVAGSGTAGACQEVMLAPTA